MDFFSNLINRPRSSVANESPNTTDDMSVDTAGANAVDDGDELALNTSWDGQSSTSSPMQTARTSVTPPPASPRESSKSPPIIVNSLIGSAINTPLQSPQHGKVGLLSGGDGDGATAPSSTLAIDDVKFCATSASSCPSTSSCIDTTSSSSACTGAPLLMRSQSGTHTCLNATSNAIEELLIHINDSLDQATIDEEEEGEVPGGGERDGFVKNASVKLGGEPSPNKSFGIKMSPGAVAPSSPHQQALGAASNATTPTTPKMALIDPEMLIFTNNNNNNNINTMNGGTPTGVNKSSNKFIGLTEFDESKIPDLPGGLNSDLEDQLKLTFEEGLIPTLTANVNTSSSGSFRKDKINALIEKETDAAFSSDNETFAECQPFPDAANYTADMHGLEHTMELSAADAYRSALNSYNANLTCDAVDPLNGTLENITMPGGEEAELVGAQCGDGPMNMTFEDEPMDVDVSMVMMPQVEPSMPHLEMSLPKVEAVSPKVEPSLPQVEAALPQGESSLPQVVAVSPKVEPSLAQVQLSSMPHVEPSLQQMEHKLPTESPPSQEVAASSSLSNDEAGAIGGVTSQATSTAAPTEDPAQSIAWPNSPSIAGLNTSNEATTKLLNESVIQDNSVDSATDILPVMDECSGEELGFHRDQVEISAPEDITSTASGPVAQPTMPDDTMTASSSSFDPKLSITLDMTSSFASARSSAPTSPNFPLKPSKDEAKHFPRSPRAEGDKEMPFMEKSEYAEHLNATRKKSVECMRPSGAHLQAELAQPEGEPKQSPKLTGCQAKLDATFEGDDEAVASDEDREKRRTFNVDFDKEKRSTFNVPESGNRHTFNVIPEDKPDSSSMPHALEKRHTYDVAAAKPNDQTVEAMECDDDLALASQVPPPACPTSPPIPTLQKRSTEPLAEYPATPPPQAVSPPLPTLQKRKQADMENESVFRPPPPAALLKRPSIHRRSSSGQAANTEESALSEKEQTKSNEMDEKEQSFVEQFGASMPIEDMFARPTASSTEGASNFAEAMQASASGGDEKLTDADFQSGSNLILNPSDFDYLLTKGNSDNSQVNRSSLLMRFDPLLGFPVPGNYQQQQQLPQPQFNNENEIFSLTPQSSCLSPTIEEDEHNDSAWNRSLDGADAPVTARLSYTGARAKNSENCHRNEAKDLNLTSKNKNNATMSVDVINDMNIENDCNKASFENSNNLQLDEKQSNYKMDELEKKIKNEVLKTEDIEKKLKDAEQREEALIKRITEKDKTISKMNGVIESYEKTIAELVREKEQLIQNYEKQLAEVKADRDSNYHHLTSLETTFSDLHVKYEKSKEMTSQLKNSEEALLAEKRQNLENLRLQEQRYEKMKNHAMQQLEIANKKLESLTKEHSHEATKLKALLKKEEISRASTNEQLIQKTRENAELMKICDELINGPANANPAPNL